MSSESGMLMQGVSMSSGGGVCLRTLLGLALVLTGISCSLAAETSTALSCNLPLATAVPVPKTKSTVKTSTDPSAALLAAAESDDLKEVQRLLRRGADVNARDTHCGTPLMMAVGNSDSAMVQALL